MATEKISSRLRDAVARAAKKSHGTWLPAHHRRRMPYLPTCLGKRARGKHYYRVRCFSGMLDLPMLIPATGLKLQSGRGAGRSWCRSGQHWGRIDVDKIAAFMVQMIAYDKAREIHAVEDKEF
ncbi:hypothetical protein BBO_07616 [Beauveria brongniartii RCEF 3172]|uniref:Uncharacterized protein n=1 Tax=Beauveria brongniartii RCEF 3172 TaxID=1081107 RepID=A0A166Z5M9_9HYPO|nr:hypothetical protein BBO_07616 [Beauveria brongniartii RCEF 3172]